MLYESNAAWNFRINFRPSALKNNRTPCYSPRSSPHLLVTGVDFFCSGPWGVILGSASSEWPCELKCFGLPQFGMRHPNRILHATKAGTLSWLLGEGSGQRKLPATLNPP